MLQRIIPSTGDKLPVIGLGTWQTFDVAPGNYASLKNVLDTLQEAGGTLIDSSPMYGKAEQVVGDITSQMKGQDDFFYATKVWTTGLKAGIEQMENSFAKMQRTTIDLMQIHNLVDWETQVKQLRSWKEQGKIRHIGITHYTDASHAELQSVLQKIKPGFVQFNYSILARNAEKNLLKVASDNGVATIINRPFGEGNLFNKVKGKSLPVWAVDYGIDSWAVYFLKYIIAHPAVTCVIPATGNAAHAADNMKAGVGILPDEKTRKMMVDYLLSV